MAAGGMAGGIGGQAELGGNVGVAIIAGAPGGGTAGALPGGLIGPIQEVASRRSDFGNLWASSWVLSGCAEQRGHECLTQLDTCPNDTHNELGGTRTLETFALGGMHGQHYKVTFQFNAVASLQTCEGGVRDQGTTLPDPSKPADTFYRDGRALPNERTTWKLTVFDEVGVEARHYYLNSVPYSDQIINTSFAISYTKTIVVVGGGKITYVVQDPDCRVVDNCGPNTASAAAPCEPRNIPNEPADVALPAMYPKPTIDGNNQVLVPTHELSVVNPTATQPWHSQIGHLTITKIEATADPPATDYL